MPLLCVGAGAGLCAQPCTWQPCTCTCTRTSSYAPVSGVPSVWMVRASIRLNLSPTCVCEGAGGGRTHIGQGQETQCQHIGRVSSRHRLMGCCWCCCSVAHCMELARLPVLLLLLVVAASP